MPKYRVLRPIEHNGKLHLPEDPHAPKTATSGSHGGEIDVDSTGIIELAEAEAKPMDLGQIEEIKDKSTRRDASQREGNPLRQPAAPEPQRGESDSAARSQK